MAATTSPNMSLTIPVVSDQPGPLYATNVNTSLTVIDAHDHSAGKGVQITPAGMNINVDLNFNNQNIFGTRSVRLNSNASPIALATDLDCVYVSGVDLYYNDGNGNNIRLTQGGGIVGTSGSITGLTSPASASYVSGSSTFIWQSGVNTPANMDFASAIFRNLSAGSNGVTVQAATSLASSYSLTLPLLPASQSFMTLDGAGVMATPITFSQGITAANIANQTITAAQIANATITATQIAANAGITGTQIASQTIAQGNLAVRALGQSVAAGGVATSLSSGTFSTTSASFVRQFASATATVSVASPAVAGVSSTTGYFVGQPVIFTTTGALPTGITAGTTYYISNVINSTTFNVAASPGGANINTTGTQSGTHTVTRTTFALNIATTGRPVMVMLVPDTTATAASIGVSGTNLSTGTVGTISLGVKIVRNSSIDLATSQYAMIFPNPTAGSVGPLSMNAPPGEISFIDTPAAGNWTYEVQIKQTATGVTAATGLISNCQILAYEI